MNLYEAAALGKIEFDRVHYSESLVQKIVKTAQRLNAEQYRENAQAVDIARNSCHTVSA